MLNTRCTARRRARRILDIGQDAERLGVSREQLRLVLGGKRKSKSLLSRYLKLKAAQSSAPTKTKAHHP